MVNKDLTLFEYSNKKNTDGLSKLARLCFFSFF